MTLNLPGLHLYMISWKRIYAYIISYKWIYNNTIENLWSINEFTIIQLRIYGELINIVWILINDFTTWIPIWIHIWIHIWVQSWIHMLHFMAYDNSCVTFHIICIQIWTHMLLFITYEFRDEFRDEFMYMKKIAKSCMNTGVTKVPNNFSVLRFQILAMAAGAGHSGLSRCCSACSRRRPPLWPDTATYGSPQQSRYRFAIHEPQQITITSE